MSIVVNLLVFSTQAILLSRMQAGQTITILIWISESEVRMPYLKPQAVSLSIFQARIQQKQAQLQQVLKTTPRYTRFVTCLLYPYAMAQLFSF